MSFKGIVDKMLGAPPASSNATDLDTMLEEHMKQMKEAMASKKPVPQALIDEVIEIERERNVVSKSKRLETFKKFPAHIRERLVEQYTIRDLVNEMNDSTPELDQKEWETKQKIRGLDRDHYAGDYRGNANRATNNHPDPEIVIPGVTYEDLRKAHFDATAEEELVNHSTESKDS